MKGGDAMRMRRERSGSLALTGLEPFFVQLLRHVAEAADPGEEPAANARLFSAPARGEALAEIRDDWAEYVQPELRLLFESARTTVQRDLARMKAELSAPKEDDPELGAPQPTFRLTIPTKHFDAWLNALNQARLAIGARYNFSEADMSDRPRFPLASERDYRLFQMDFYGYIQEHILMQMENLAEAKEEAE